MQGSFAREPLRRGAAILARLASRAASPEWLKAPTPTADIYFLNAMGDLLSPERGVRALGPNVYGANERYVVLRYASGAELALLEAARPRRVIYVVDDDLESLSRSSELPTGYRSRLAGFVELTLPRILAMADTVLAPNLLLLDRFRDHTTGVIPPSYCSVCDDFAHFQDGSALRLVFTGSRSHVADLAAIAPALERLCTLHPEIELTTFLGPAAPAPLRRLSNVANRPALPWASYRHVMETERFHVALAPFRRIPTNECRSHNKVHDHAAFGAAGLYGDILPYRETVSNGRDGLLLPPESGSWLDALDRLVRDPASARRLAEAGAGLSRRVGDPAQLRAFWCEQFKLATP